MALPQFPHTEVREIDAWTNFHGTIPHLRVPIYCTPDVLGEAGEDGPRRLKRHGDAIRSVIEFCLSNDKRLRVMGARWSLSRIIEPTDVVLDPGNLTVMLRVKDDWISDAYKQKRPGRVPIFTQCGSTISSINRRLGEIDLALQTCGASNGHRIAGCIATGTHGSAIGVGAVHDTVLGLHLVVGPEESYFVQPEQTPAIHADFAGWLQDETGIPTENLRDDDVFAAALVSLGSLGIVHAVVLEAVPNYRLSGQIVRRTPDDAEIWHAIRTLDTTALHPSNARIPYHFGVVINP